MKKSLALMLALIMVLCMIPTTALAANWNPDDKITIKVRIFNPDNGAYFVVGSDECTKGDEKIQSNDYRIPELSKFIGNNSYRVEKVVGNWYFPAGDRNVGSIVNWSCNSSTATMTYWVRGYNGGNGGTGGGSTGDGSEDSGSGNYSMTYTIVYHSNYPSGTDYQQTYKYTIYAGYNIGNTGRKVDVKSPSELGFTAPAGYKPKSTPWNTKADGTGEGVSTMLFVKPNSTNHIYAQWEGALEQWIITYKDGSNIVGTDYVTKGDPTVAHGALTKDGYTFKGWSKTNDGTVQYQAGDEFTPEGNVTLYAVWKSSINPPTYEELKGLVGKVAVNCIIGTEHGKIEYDLIENSYLPGVIGTDGDGNYTYSITINPESYVATYKGTKGDHTLDPADQKKTVSFTRGKEDTGWKVVENQTVPVVFIVKHATTVPGSVSEVTKTRLNEVPAGVTLPENVTINKEEPVIFTDNNTSATLLYKFTVTGTPDAKVVIKDDGATFININGNPSDDEITVTLPNGEGDKAEITVYGYRTFSVDDIQNGKLVNNATANVEGDDNNKKEAKAEVDAKDDRTLDNTLTVKKLVSGNAANTTEKFTFKATFTFPVPGPSANLDSVTSVEKVEIIFELANGQTRTFSYTSDPELKAKIDKMKESGSLPGDGDAVFAMLSYKVEETNTKGYTLATNGDAEGKAEGHNTVTFTNTKNKPNDDHGGHYYPTTTPVPVIVIPPKTGDMTIWQSILHFLGIR